MRPTEEKKVYMLLKSVIFHYHGLDDRFGMTLEAGPTVHWRSLEYSDHAKYLQSTVLDYAAMGDQNLWEYGLDVQVGFEWFFTRHVSLSTRSGLAALRTEQRGTDDTRVSSLDMTNRDYREAHSDGYVIRTVFPLVSLNASW